MLKRAATRARNKYREEAGERRVGQEKESCITEECILLL